MAQCKIYSIVDLKSTYLQVPSSKKDRIYTAFEVDIKQYQFCRVPFGVTNGVVCLQRIIDKFIADKSLSYTIVYWDNITICGKNQEEHNENLNKFTEAAKKFNSIYNHNKCSSSNSTVDLLGYTISESTIKPDLTPLPTKRLMA